MSIHQRQLKTNNYGVEVTDSSSPGIKIDMFADNFTNDNLTLTEQSDFDSIVPTIKRLEKVFKEKLNFHSTKWTAPLIPLFKQVSELYKEALVSNSNKDIRKFNIIHNNYLAKLKLLKKFMNASKLDPKLLQSIPSFPNLSRKKANKTLYIIHHGLTTTGSQPLTPIQTVTSRFNPVNLNGHLRKNVDSHTIAAQNSCKTTVNQSDNNITRTFIPVPVIDDRRKKINFHTTAAQNSYKPTVNQSDNMPRIPLNKVQPQPGPIAGGSVGGVERPALPALPAYRPAGIPRSFLQPDHPLSVNYINMQGPGPMEYVAMEPQPAQTEQYNPEENFIGDQNENSQDSNPESTDVPEPGTGQKRGRAFDRLGPITQPPKTPKLTINLLFSKEQAVREVIDVDDKDEPGKSPPSPQWRYVAVPDREEVINSVNPIVLKYRQQWPWNMVFSLEKTAMPRNSKSVMIMEAEQMMDAYEKGNKYVKISISGYPPHYTKEEVLDIILDNVKDKHFVPIFIDFKPTECNFLILRARQALSLLHRRNLVISQDKLEMPLTVSTTDLGLDSVAFIPKQVLRTLLTGRMIEDISMDLREFCLQSDITNFIYYPLKRLQNQLELMDLNTKAGLWSNLRELNLSHNKLTTVDGFDLPKHTPHLQYLDLSFNYITKMTNLLCCKSLNLRALKLEGNPLCGGYIDPDLYVKVARMIFPRLREFDGISIPRLGEMPDIKQNYCPPSVKHVAEKFIETYFPLLDQSPEGRTAMEELYSESAVLTITFRYRLRYSSTFKYFRELFSRSRCLEENETDFINGGKHIVKHFTKWPEIQHDPYMTTVDVMLHEDNTTILRIGGVIRLTSSSLSEDKHMLAFSRTVVLHNRRGATYKIYNEMLQWDEVSEELAKKAFQNTVIKPKEVTLDMETDPDDIMKEGLAKIFMEITGLNPHQTERCLKLKSWNFKDAMEYFIKLVKLGSTDILDLTGN